MTCIQIYYRLVYIVERVKATNETKTTQTSSGNGSQYPQENLCQTLLKTQDSGNPKDRQLLRECRCPKRHGDDKPNTNKGEGSNVNLRAFGCGRALLNKMSLANTEKYLDCCGDTTTAHLGETVYCAPCDQFANVVLTETQWLDGTQSFTDNNGILRDPLRDVKQSLATSMAAVFVIGCSFGFYVAITMGAK